MCFLGVQEISPPSTPSNSVSSCVNHQALTPRALYTMTQHQAGGKTCSIFTECTYQCGELGQTDRQTDTHTDR